MGKRIKKFTIIGIIIFAVFLAIGLFLSSVYIFPILMYHRIDENPNNSKLVVSPQDFQAQMDFLKGQEFKVITLEELVDLIKTNKKLPPKTVAITFDDGYENNYTYAYPILKSYGFPATIFVIVNSIGKEGYLSIEQLKQMQSDKIEVGSHSFSHRWLLGLKEELVKEIFGSKKILENLLNKEIRFFSYPVGGFNDKIKEMVKSAGYLAALTTSPGRHFSNRDIFALKRVRVSGGRNNLLVFRIKVSGYYNWIKERRDED